MAAAAGGFPASRVVFFARALTSWGRESGQLAARCFRLKALATLGRRRARSLKARTKNTILVAGKLPSAIGTYQKRKPSGPGMETVTMYGKQRVRFCQWKPNTGTWVNYRSAPGTTEQYICLAGPNQHLVHVDSGADYAQCEWLSHSV